MKTINEQSTNTRLRGKHESSVTTNEPERKDKRTAKRGERDYGVKSQTDVRACVMVTNEHQIVIMGKVLNNTNNYGEATTA